MLFGLLSAVVCKQNQSTRLFHDQGSPLPSIQIRKLTARYVIGLHCVLFRDRIIRAGNSLSASSAQLSLLRRGRSPTDH